MRTFMVIAGVGLALTSGLLTGCGGTTDAAPPSPASSTTTPTASPSPTAPVLPEAAKANTKAGAVAFVRHYVDALNHGIRTGDVAHLRTLTSGRCSACAKVADQIASLYEAGGHSLGGTWKIVSARTAQSPRRGHELVYALVRFAPQRLYKTPDSKPRKYPGGKQLFNFELSYHEGWLITQSTTAS